MLDLATIEPDMEVVGSDGQHVGTVDNIGIKLTKKDVLAHDQHHYLKASEVQSVAQGKVVLGVPAAEALQSLKVVEN